MPPRIAPEDELSSDDLFMHRGEWVRTASYQEGHVVGMDSKTAPCGRPLTVGWEWWNQYRRFLETYRSHTPSGREKTADPGEFYIALDRRKGSKCTQCKNGQNGIHDELEREDHRDARRRT